MPVELSKTSSTKTLQVMLEEFRTTIKPDEGYTMEELAKKFNRGVSTVTNIVRRHNMGLKTISAGHRIQLLLVHPSVLPKKKR